MPKYPSIKVNLIGQDGNAFNLLALAQNAMRRGGVQPEDIEAFLTEAMSGDYDHLLRTIMEYVNV
jgi:hypothetical protein